MVNNQNSGKCPKRDTYTQIKAIHKFLKNNTATRKMIAVKLGIDRSSVCPKILELEKNGHLERLYKRPCQESGYLAEYLTSNEKLFPSRSQLSLVL